MQSKAKFQNKTGVDIGKHIDAAEGTARLLVEFIEYHESIIARQAKKIKSQQLDIDTMRLAIFME